MMKKISAIILAIVIAIFQATVYATEVTINGDGTVEKPYVLTKNNCKTVLELGCGENGKGVHITVSQDVEAKIGAISDRFCGILDGNGHCLTGVYFEELAAEGVIKNTKAESSDYYDAVPLVKINNGLMQNIEMERNITSGSEKSGIAGINRGVIDNCYTTYKVTTNESTVGGIVYFNDGGTIRNSVNRARIYATGQYAGGIAAKTKGGIIENCANTNEVVSESGIVGGIVGESEGTVIRNCVVSGSVKGSVNAGGIVGLDLGNTVVENCYFDCEKNESGKIAVGGTKNQSGAHTTEELKNPETYTGFDFENDWTIFWVSGAAAPLVRFGNGSAEYPYLIYNSSDLTAFEGDTGSGKYIKLMDDVNTHLNVFKGYLDGNGKNFESSITVLDEGASVKNVYFSKSFGAIEYIYKGIVEDCIASPDAYRIIGKGGFIGVNDGGIVRNCELRNRIWYFVHGGIFAHINKNGGIIENCKINTSVFAYNYKTHVNGETGTEDVGSVVWLNDDAKIVNCEVILTGMDADKFKEVENVPFALKNNGEVENCIYTMEE